VQSSTKKMGEGYLMTSKKYDDLLYRGCLLDLQMKEGSGVKTQDWAKPHHKTRLINTPTWTDIDGLNLIELDGALEFIQSYSGDTADLDFVADDFGIMSFVYFDAIGSRESILTRGQEDVDGYAVYKDANDAIVFETYQAGATQITKTGNSAVSAITWYHIMITRSGASVRIYINGVDKTSTVGTHINPTTATRELKIGRA